MNYFRFMTTIHVHNVWINKSKFESREECLCGIPLDFIDKVIENALHYTEAKFTLWLDYELLGDTSLFLAKSHFYFAPRLKETEQDKVINCMKRIKFRNLREIEEYKKNGIFNSQENGWLTGLFRSGKSYLQIYKRVDLAKLLVLKMALEEDPDSTHVYADFDVDDIKINDQEFQKFKGDHGIVFGTVKDSRKWDLSTIIENGFLAITNRHKEWLNDLIKETEATILQGMDSEYRHEHPYEAFVAAAEKLRCEIGSRFPVIPVLDRTRTEFPFNPTYRELGLSSPPIIFKGTGLFTDAVFKALRL